METTVEFGCLHPESETDEGAFTVEHLTFDMDGTEVVAHVESTSTFPETVEGRPAFVFRDSDGEIVGGGVNWWVSPVIGGVGPGTVDREPRIDLTDHVPSDTDWEQTTGYVDPVV